MNPILKNVLATLGGLVSGSAVNIGLIFLGIAIIAPPAGVDPMDPESLAANMHLFEVKHFIFPFLAHAGGTFVGALFAYKFAANSNEKFAYVIGGLFLVGGIMNVIDLGGPMWFNVTDVLLAYIPMSFLAVKVASSK